MFHVVLNIYQTNFRKKSDCVKHSKNKEYNDYINNISKNGLIYKLALA